ncbi:M20/M25/M40 family metallo-hydrolase [Metabacillus fastidiosus]|uniref:M20/M25/M40 family metallo-hydrolase n=1 Tax=Metabacillus fastidiosus TaxID=1458 RepID=UPI002E1BEC82|nr:M20/M25/M40 family metallo-hydrolase [Metabacillus fastidiosus]MED4531645.1 M20/M25/M40 family metallo-hydrolase [Metabacillus fastidiosus]
MEIIPPANTERHSQENWKKHALIFICVTYIIFAAVFLSFLQLKSPKVIPTADRSAEFSAERAFTHLEKFTVAPHPLGSKEHDKVRDYLVESLQELGLNPEIQKADSFYQSASRISGGAVENITAKIKGKNSTKAIMLVAHYDSVPGSPGAADDGAGVSAILETVRALKETKPLQNDVIILLTDGEENGLLGAKAFVNEHPWVKDVGLVLNFEARGNEGPSLMFETSDNNSWIVKEFIEAAPTPVTHSFIYSLYKLMPNDTDLTIFKEAGLNGLNFAFGEGLSHYHTTSDNLQELSKESLQHHGEYMLSLVRHFGQLDLAQMKEGNEVFFNIFGSTVISYSEDLATPIMVIVVILFILTVAHGHRREKLSLPGTLGGFLITVFGMIGSFAIGFGLWSLLTSIFSEKRWILETDTVFGTVYLLSFSIIIFAFSAFLYKLAAKKIMTGSLAAGSLLTWLIFVIAASLHLKAGSYIFAWPLFFGLIGINIFLYMKEAVSYKYIILACFAVPGFLIASPVIYLIQKLMSIEIAGILAVLVFLLGTLLTPIFSTLKIKADWFIPSILLCAGLAILVTNSVNANKVPTAEHRAVSDIIYLQDADKNEAYWIARYGLDDYTSNYINKDVKQGSVSSMFPLFSWEGHYGQAEPYHLKAPDITVLSDMAVLSRIDGNKRELIYELKTNRSAEEILLKSLSPITVSELFINHKKVELNNQYAKPQPLLLTYIPGETGRVNIKITVDYKDKVEWIVADRSYNIPEIKEERSEKYSSYGDSSFVMKTIRD